ncbi:MAG TPA: competence/damage-inducible protein A, partial [Brevundimonas diminuta]|nr:competence/damage-inducible protein A [Brevundimonas diminuta]
RYAPGEFNAARRRMARVPDGGVLIANPVSGAPGFQVENVFVMAGVPKIMEAMLDDVAPRLKTGVPVHSRSLRVAGVGEGAVADILRAAAEARPHLSFGSYPFGFSVGQTPGQVGTHLVIRGRDSAEVDAAEHDLAANLRSSGIEIAAT